MFISSETAESSDIQAMDVDERVDDVNNIFSDNPQTATPSSQMQVDEEMVSALPRDIGSFQRGITASHAFNSTNSLTPPFNSTSFLHSDFAMKFKFPETHNPAPHLPPPNTSLSSPIHFDRKKQRFPRTPPSSSKRATLSRDDQHHLSTIKNTFGARMLANMGWEPGTGLGPTGDGIVTPIQTKLRPKKMGIAFDGFKEKTGTAQAKEVRSVGDEGELERQLHGKKADLVAEKKRAVWQRPTKVKTKTVYKTYEEIIAESQSQTPSSLDTSTTRPTNTLSRIPELRHNIHLLSHSSSSELETLTREARALDGRKKWITIEDAWLRNAVEEDEARISQLQKVHEIVNEIGGMSQEMMGSDGSVPERFFSLVRKLSDDFPREFEEYQLDEIVVAAIAPLVQRMVSTWDPLSNPTKFIPLFRDLGKPLPVTSSNHTTTAERKMTPYETLLHTTWLPKVRTTLTNSWSPQNPHPALALYESYSPLLPPFIRDNILDQLLRKVQLAISEWDPKSKRLHAIVFPWLPHLGPRMDDFLSDAREKVKSMLRAWSVGDAVEDILVWKDVFDTEWDGMMGKYIVPKLESSLHNLIINPHQIHSIKPLQHLLQSTLLPPSLISPLLTNHFFPKWLDTLHSKLTEPNANFADIARWYSDWRVFFPDAVGRMEGVNATVKRGFEEGLRVMNEAVELGEDARMRLRRPRFPSPSSTLLLNAPSNRNPPKLPNLPPHKQITFRSIVEDTAAEHNLLLIPTGRAHAVHGRSMPLFGISSTESATRSGGKGLLIYILDDAVWAIKDGLNGEDGEGDFVAIGLDEMVRRVMGGGI